MDKIRKQTKRIFIILMMCFALVGCGHRNKEELTDIEQFRCQDSMQTVFDVLGKTELENGTFGGEYYTYDNLNLWGYDGKAVFNVRNDKDTIQSFECNLKLNSKEFENVLSQLTDKYGEYEKHEYSNQIAYVWEIPQDKAEELGYNSISFSDYGDKKFIVSFRDEWSGKNDEAYYKHLEEEEQINVLAKKTYNIGEDTFNFLLEEDNNEYKTTLICQIGDKSDAFSAHFYLNMMFNSDDESLKALTETMNFSYCIVIGDGTLLMRTDSFLSLVNGEKVLDVTDYFSPDWMISEEYHESDYGSQVIDFLSDFIENE